MININIQLIKAVVIKEAQSLQKNSNVLVMYLLPIIFTLIYDKIIPDMPPGFALGFGLLFLVVMVGMYVPSMLLAEEKEKKTIEVLLLSPASAGDVLLGKGLLTFFSIILVTGILLLISLPSGVNLLAIFAMTVLISVFSIFIGMMVGLLSPTQMATGTIGMPVYLMLILVPQLVSFAENRVLEFIARLLPTHYYFRSLDRILAGGAGWQEIRLDMLIIALSTVLTFYILLFVYRKKGIEAA